MRVEDLKLEELVTFSEGWFHLEGRRLVLHDIHAFAQFRKDLVTSVGPDQGRRILTRFGYFWGQADAAAMKRIFVWEDLGEWLKAGPRMHTLQGVVRSSVENLEYEKASGQFHMRLLWRDSGEAEEHLISFGKTDHPVCWMLAGYASGYASFCMDRAIYFIEEKCRAKGNRVCSAVGRDADSWGKDLSSILPFFQAEEIHEKILHLTRELKRKSKVIEKQQRELDRFQIKRHPGLVEIRSESFRRVLELAQRIAPFDTSLLITGETGVGKEIIAQHIRDLSRREKGPFVKINCGALPESLLESELFGHKTGAFTGAVHDRVGLFEQAHKGTIFLDEIGDVSPALQVKLLRVLQEKEIIPVGDSVAKKVDVRIIAATNKDLNRMVEANTFRQDLLYRLRVVEIHVPPLRERKEDILSFARYFVTRFAKKLNIPNLRLDAGCLDLLTTYPWPGNVRELENALERAALLCKDGHIRCGDLPQEIGPTAPVPQGDKDLRKRSLAEVEADHIRAVMEFTKGHQTQAAKILGISFATLWRKLKKLD